MKLNNLPENGNAGRRVLILTALGSILGLASGLFYRLAGIPGASEIWEKGEGGEKIQLLKSAATGEPLPGNLAETIKNRQAIKGKLDKFEQRLGRLRAKDKNFSFADGNLLKEIFYEKNINKYLNSVRVYLETIFNDYTIKSEIPVELLVLKINEFPEKRIYALICCCCGLPDDKGLNYLASALFKRGFAGLDEKKRQDALYFLKVIEAVTYLRSYWYNNFFDEATKNPDKSGALQLMWNFLNVYELPQDLIKTKEYYAVPLS
jgi:hypothetical protein